MHFCSYSFALLQTKLCCLKVILLNVCLYVCHIYLSMPLFTYSQTSEGNNKFQNLPKVMLHTVVPTHFLCSEWYLRKLAAYFWESWDGQYQRKLWSLATNLTQKFTDIRQLHMETHRVTSQDAPSWLLTTQWPKVWSLVLHVRFLSSKSYHCSIFTHHRLQGSAVALTRHPIITCSTLKSVGGFAHERHLTGYRIRN